MQSNTVLCASNRHQKETMILREYRSYEVTLSLNLEKTYVVDARTPEEAEDIALEMLEDDGFASIAATVEDVMPVDELTSDEIFPEP